MTSVERLNEFLRALDRISLADLEVLSLPESDPHDRAALLDRVDDAARTAGSQRASQIHEGRLRVRELMFARFASTGIDVTWAGLGWQGHANRASERVKLILAVEDAAVAAMMSDRLEPDDIDALGEQFAIARSMPGIGRTGVPDLRSSRAAAGPLAAIVLMTGTGGLGFVAAIAALLRRRRKRLGDQD